MPFFGKRGHFLDHPRVLHPPRVRFFGPVTDRIYIVPDESAVSPPVVYRGEGEGARLYDPERDAPGAVGDKAAEETGSRRIADPRVARVLDENAVGESFTWMDERTGGRNTVTPTRDGEGKGSCRAFRHVVIIPSGQIEAAPVACRTPEGKWEIDL